MERVPFFGHVRPLEGVRRRAGQQGEKTCARVGTSVEELPSSNEVSSNEERSAKEAFKLRMRSNEGRKPNQTTIPSGHCLKGAHWKRSLNLIVGAGSPVPSDRDPAHGAFVPSFRLVGGGARREGRLHCGFRGVAAAGERFPFNSGFKRAPPSLLPTRFQGEKMLYGGSPPRRRPFVMPAAESALKRVRGSAGTSEHNARLFTQHASSPLEIGHA